MNVTKSAAVRRFERLFLGGDAAAVRDAVAAYRNPDGGFGHALEPDGRTPVSQPAATEMALRVLHEADAWDEGLVSDACDWLELTAPGDGGATFVLPGVEAWPHAPWWQPQPGLPPSLITTGQLAGTLDARHADHPWLDGATAWLWRRLDGPADELGAYDLLGACRFLDRVPDRHGAEMTLERLIPRLREVITLDPAATGEVHDPLFLAPEPDCIARRAFADETIEEHLDHLAAAQADDGGWTFNWLAWPAVAAAEWRGVMTVEALRLLRANQRLPQTGQGDVPRAW